MIEIVSASVEGEGWRFQVGVRDDYNDCLDYRVHSAGYADTGGTICRYEDDPSTHPPAYRNWRSSTQAVLIAEYAGCVQAPIHSLWARDTETTTTMCDARIPPVVFGRVTGDIAYTCLVAHGREWYPDTNQDGVFLFLETASTPLPGFALAFTANGHFRGDPPVDAPFAPGLEACEDLAPWADQPGWGQPRDRETPNASSARLWLEAGGWRLGAGGWGLEVGGRRTADSGRRTTAERSEATTSVSHP